MKILSTIIIAFIITLSINAQTTEIEHLIADDAAGSSYFGHAVSISGDYAVIGANIADGNVTNSGAAYVFQFTAGSWSQVAKLTPSDGEADDYFGVSVDISGDYIIVGSHYNEGREPGTGAAYIYEKPGTGWTDMTETQKLTAADGEYYDYYGISVSIDGNYAAVGAENDDESYSNSGSVYIYLRGAVEWTLQEKINHGDMGGSDYFGCAVSLEGTHLVAGAKGNNDWGSGYVFERSGTTWTQIAKLSASDANSGDQLGFSVDISGDWIILSGYLNDEAGSNAGAAYMYKKPGTGWASSTETQKLVPAELGLGDLFGFTVRIDATNAVISATYDDDTQSNAGAAYLYKLDGSTWIKNTKYLPATGTNNAWFGTGLSIDGDHILIGEPNNDDNNLSSGKVYYYSPVKIYITEQPNDLLNVCCFTDELFIVKGGNIDNYQWQISTNNGGSWSNITDNTIYTGSNNDTLTVHTEAALDNYQYRCYISNSNYNATSDAALLTIESVSPTITSTHNDQTISLDESCEASLPDYTTDVVANDNCDTDLTITQTPAPGIAISGSTNSVTLRATDDAGNYDEITFNVAVVDDTDPVITSTHETYAQPANENCLGILPDFTGDVVAYDNCDSNLEITQSPAAGTENSGSTVTIYVTDDAGNQTTVSFGTTIIDTTAPIITSTHTDQTIDADANCEAEVPNYTYSFWISDYCDPAPTKSQIPAPGSIISGELNTIKLIATDASGNKDSVLFNLAVIDNSPPQITSSHPNISMYPLISCDTILPDFLSTFTVVDNCDATVTITQTPEAGLTINGSDNTITLTATDSQDLSSSVTFNIAVTDTVGPELVCPEDQIREADIYGNYTVQAGEFIVLDTSDNCNGVQYIRNSINNSIWIQGTVFPVGTHSITWTGFDYGGYTSTCSFNVQIDPFNGIADFHDSGIQIYPNPAKETFTINSDIIDIESVVIKDISGKTVYIESQLRTRKKDFDISSFSKGVYIVEIKSHQQTFNTKLIIE
jgi:hypothetical protein